MTGIRTSRILGQILGRALLPQHVARWLGLRRRHRRTPTVRANAQLKLYNRILAGDFLHYGYFDDPDTSAEAIGFAALERAQHRYAEKILERIHNPDLPILDVGSGMGGMLGLLCARGHDATGLTPDRFQIEHIGRAYPNAALLGCRFEELPAHDHRSRFGTVIHAESIQYMEQERVLPIVDEILAPGGRWIVADYFRISDPDTAALSSAAGRAHRSGWLLDDFRRRLDRAGFRIAEEIDITAHVLPTLAFAHLLATRLGLPAIDFAAEKLQDRAPVCGYILHNIVTGAQESALGALEAIDPSIFAATKRYVIFTCCRA